MTPTLKEKIAHAMVGHTLVDVTAVLVEALGAVLQEADPAVRERVVEEVCAKIARKAFEKAKG